jgi:hypothetical protein
LHIRPIFVFSPYITFKLILIVAHLRFGQILVITAIASGLKLKLIETCKWRLSGAEPGFDYRGGEDDNCHWIV